MSQQGGRPTGHEDDWWGQLYDDSTEDTGPAPAADSLDDRFASALGAVNAVDARPADTDEPWWAANGDELPYGVPDARSGTAPPGTPYTTPPVRDAAPPEQDVVLPAQEAAPPAPGVAPAPPGAPPGPTTFPSGPLPPGFAERPSLGPPDPQGPTSTTTGGRTSAETPSAASVRLPDGLPPGASSPVPPARNTPVPDSTIPAARTAPADPTPGRDDRRSPTVLDLPLPLPPVRDYVGSGPPTYEAEPTALPPADPDELDDLVADTVLDGARYGVCTLRAVSVRGDSARYRGEPRRDSLLTARFGAGEHALVLVAMATGARATAGAHRAAAEVCQWIGRAVGRSHARLAEDIRAGRRGDLKSGLHRLTDRSLGRLRAGAAEQGLDPEEYAATLRCLLLPADPECRTRVFFGVGAGGLFRIRGGAWQDIEPGVGEVAGEPVLGFGSLPSETPEGDRLTMDLAITTPPSPYDPPPEPPREPFRFRASVARPGDTLLMCTGGLADPLRGEPELAAHLTERWSAPAPPGLTAFLTDTQVRVKGYADDRTAAAVWEA